MSESDLFLERPADKVFALDITGAHRLRLRWFPQDGILSVLRPDGEALELRITGRGGEVEIRAQKNEKAVPP